MAKSFDELTRRTMSKAARARAHTRAREIMADMFLKQIRQSVGLSQIEAAKRLGIRQPSYSKLESAEQDMQVQTLRRLVEALGGHLEIVARFPKASVRVADFSDRPKARKAAELELV